MPKFRFHTWTLALLAMCVALWGCPQTPVPGGTSGDDFGGFPGQSTPRPTGSATAKPSATPSPTPTTGSTPTPTPSPTASGSQPRLQSVKVLNPISQMWLLEQVPTTTPPVSIPSTYSFRAEVVTFYGTAASTSSAVVWTSSNPAILTIDPDTGYATTQTAQGLYMVTVRAATSNPAASNPAPQGDTVTLTVGNSGAIDVTIE